MPNEQFGARFFDAQKRDRGRASKVVKRPLAVGRLFVLDVATVRIQGVLQNT